MSPQIQLHRGGYQFTDRTVGYKIIIDDVPVGVIAEGNTTAFAVSPGEHRVQLQSSWFQSEPISVRVGYDEVVELECEEPPLPARTLFSKLRVHPRRYMSLLRQR